MIAIIALFYWIGFSFALAIAAEGRGRIGPAWFFLSLVISPPMAWAFLYALPPKAAGSEQW